MGELHAYGFEEHGLGPILRVKPGGTEVSAIDPVAAMGAVDNAQLAVIAAEVKEKLEKVLSRV